MCFFLIFCGCYFMDHYSIFLLLCTWFIYNFSHNVLDSIPKLMREKSITRTVRAITVVELNVGSLGSFWYTTLYLEITPFGMLGSVQLSRRESALVGWAKGASIPCGSASKVRTEVQKLEAEPLELTAVTLYSYSLNGRRESEASMNSRGPSVQMNTSSSSWVPIGCLEETELRLRGKNRNT